MRWQMLSAAFLLVIAISMGGRRRRGPRGPPRVNADGTEADKRLPGPFQRPPQGRPPPLVPPKPDLEDSSGSSGEDSPTSRLPGSSQLTGSRGDGVEARTPSMTFTAHTSPMTTKPTTKRTTRSTPGSEESSDWFLKLQPGWPPAREDVPKDYHWTEGDSSPLATSLASPDCSLEGEETETEESGMSTKRIVVIATASLAGVLIVAAGVIYVASHCHRTARVASCTSSSLRKPTSPLELRMSTSPLALRMPTVSVPAPDVGWHSSAPFPSYSAVHGTRMDPRHFGARGHSQGQGQSQGPTLQM